MANKFVWSGAGGLNDGSSWDNAYTSLMRDWGAEAGFDPAVDFVYVRSVHSETSTAALTITGTTGEGGTPVRVICVVGDTTGTTPGALATGADASCITSTTSDLSINEKLYIYGVDFASNDDLNLGFSTASIDDDVVLEKCSLTLTGAHALDAVVLSGAGTSARRILLIDTDVQFGTSSQGFSIDSAHFRWIGGALLLNNVASLIEINPNSRSCLAEIENVDLSVLTGAVVAAAGMNANMSITLRRCLMGTGSTLITGTIDVPGVVARAYHCQIGTDADPAYAMEVQSIEGSVKTDTSRYRTGGASDGVRTNPISWDLDTVAGTVRQYPGFPLESPPIVGWTPGDGVASHTYRIYFASDASIDDDDVWFDLVLPNDAATNSLGVRKTKRLAPQGTPAAHTTDGASTWTGTGVTTKQYMELTHTPDKPGPIEARIYMAKGADNVYVDPKIYVDP